MSKESVNQINYLLRKYDKRRVNGEFFTKDYASVKNMESKHQNRRDTLTQLCNIQGLTDNSTVRTDSLYWLDKIKDLQCIYGQWTQEKLIAMLILNQMQYDNPKTFLEDTYLWKEYDFTPRQYTVARSNLYRKILNNHVILRDPDNLFRFYKREKPNFEKYKVFLKNYNNILKETGDVK